MKHEMTDNGSNTLRIRNARACEACRATKSRCCFKNQQETCLKCESNGSQCIVRVKARPLRSRSTRPSPVSTTSNPSNSNDPNSNEPNVLISLPAVVSLDSNEDVYALQEHHKKEFEDEDTVPSLDRANPVPRQPNAGARSTILGQREVTLGHAESLLSTYLKQAGIFPFVEVSNNATVRSLSRTSPFLLLAMLTSASISEPQLHHQMDHEFRRVLSSKIIVEGRKSLEFLQGLLVYVAWYPYHANPKNNQSVVFMNLAIGLVTDLGLDHETPSMSSFNSVNPDGLIRDCKFTAGAKRAYLGCYYLSSMLSTGFQKPNNLQFRDLMDTHSESLLKEEQAATVYSLVKLQQLAEHISRTNMMRSDQHESLSSDIEIQIRLNKLQAWRSYTPQNVRDLPFVGVAERFVKITIYSQDLGFLRRPYRYNPQRGTLSLSNQIQLFNCLEACKSFFEYLLSLPSTSFLNFTMVQWSHMIQAILVLSRLTFVIATVSGWDSNSTRSNVPMVMYLDCLCFRFQSLSSASANGSITIPNLDAFGVLSMILGSLKVSYERRVSNIQPGIFMDKSDGRSLSHCPMRDPNISQYLDYEYLPGEDFQDPNLSMETSSCPFPASWDVWATMTGNWAEGF